MCALTCVWGLSFPAPLSAQLTADQLNAMDQAFERAVRSRDAEQVAQLAARLRETDPDNVRNEMLIGQWLYRVGSIEPAIEALERVARARPQDRPFLWQLGISYYDAGRFGEGTSLFEEHRRVNPNDVENALYHWLCVAGDQGVEVAKQRMLPAPGDPRIPMNEVYQLYAGKGSPEAVQAAAEQLSTDDPRAPDAQLFADLYIGLWHHAHGRREAAASSFQAAAQTKQTHYMADVARVWNERYEHRQ